MRRFRKTIITLIFMTALALVCAMPTFALNFNGSSSAAGDGSSTTNSRGGYAIPDMLANNSNRAVGYRFTVIDNKGNGINGSKDVYRHATQSKDRKNYLTYYKPNAKYPKTYIRGNYSWLSVSTSNGYSGCWWDKDLGLALPEVTTQIEGWCNDSNVSKLLSKLWSISISTLESSRWAVLIEPIFPVKIQGTYHSLTVTEIAFYGSTKFGIASNGNISSNSNSWGFIANYTNRHLPNSLRLKAAYVGIPAAANTTVRITFESIIKNGYGAAILYGSNLSRPAQYYLDVKGILNDDMVYDLKDCGTCDVYVNGKLVANDVTDYYQKVDAGSNYKITDVKPKSHLDYNGASWRGDAIEGKVTKNIAVCPDFTTKRFYLDVNGVLDGEQEVTLDGWCTFDVYLDGKLYKEKVSDFYEKIKYGTAYTITNIRPAEGKTFFGAVTDLAPYPSSKHSFPRYPSGLSGTMGLDNQYIFLGLETDKPLEAVLIESNAPYREETYVITSGFIVNPSGRDYTPDKDLKARLEIITPTEIIYSEEKSVIVPKKDKNLCYFKWRVPKDIGGEVSARLTVVSDGKDIFTDGKSYDTVPYTYLTTPDTSYEAAAPAGFGKAYPPGETEGYATWWEYVYTDTGFEKRTYGIGIDGSPDALYPARGADNKISSGRGFYANITANFTAVSGTNLALYNSYTDVQYITALFPEFGYAEVQSKCKTLIKNTLNGFFEFPDNFGYGRQHFIPLSYPDGNYVIQLIKTDMWTPAGAVTAKENSKPLKISGSVYDEYYIGR